MPVPYSAVNQPEVRHSASEHSLSTSRTSGQQSPSRIRPAFSRAICEPGRYVENSRSIRSSSASTARTAGCVTEALRMKLNTVPITSYRWRRRSHVTPDIHPRGRWRFRLSPPGSNRATRQRSTYYCKAMVTKRIKKMMIAGQEKFQVGIPIHWGYRGLEDGRPENQRTPANLLSPTAIDPNAYTPEFKAFLVNIEKA